jgi:hypothetical protein
LELNLIYPTTIVTNSGLPPKFTIKIIEIIIKVKNPDSIIQFIIRSIQLSFAAAGKS